MVNEVRVLVIKMGKIIKKIYGYLINDVMLVDILIFGFLKKFFLFEFCIVEDCDKNECFFEKGDFGFGVFVIDED